MWGTTNEIRVSSNVTAYPPLNMILPAKATLMPQKGHGYGGKWLTQFKDGLSLNFEFPLPINFDGYSFMLANDFPHRDPGKWTVKVLLEDGSSYEE